MPTDAISYNYSQGSSISNFANSLSSYSSYTAGVSFDADHFELKLGGDTTFSGRDILFKLQQLEVMIAQLESENRRLEKQLKLYILKENTIDE